MAVRTTAVGASSCSCIPSKVFSLSFRYFCTADSPTDSAFSSESPSVLFYRALYNGFWLLLCENSSSSLSKVYVSTFGLFFCDSSSVQQPYTHPEMHIRMRTPTATAPTMAQV